LGVVRLDVTRSQHSRAFLYKVARLYKKEGSCVYVCECVCVCVRETELAVSYNMGEHLDVNRSQHSRAFPYEIARLNPEEGLCMCVCVCV